MDAKIKIESENGNGQVLIAGNREDVIIELAFLFLRNREFKEIVQGAIFFSERYLEDKKDKAEAPTPPKKTEFNAHRHALDVLEAAIQHGSVDTLQKAYAGVMALKWNGSQITMYTRYCNLLKRALEKSIG